MGDLIGASLLVLVLSIPLALSVWALLDAAHRPAWAWALAGRSQAVWIAASLFGTLSLLPGIIIASWYLLRVRPLIAAAEDGRFSVRTKRGSARAGRARGGRPWWRPGPERRW